MELPDAVGQALGISIGSDKTIHLMAHCVLAGQRAERNHRKTAGHCIEKSSPEVRGEMGHEKDMCAGHDLAELRTGLHRTRKLDAAGYVQFLRQEFKRV